MISGNASTSLSVTTSPEVRRVERAGNLLDVLAVWIVWMIAAYVDGR
ncbi:MAG: hypothetical protein R3B49_00090 [Phycisphaerales bacterium]